MNHRTLLLALLPLVLAACQSDPAPASAPYDAPPAKSVAFRNTDNVVRIGLSSEPTSLNPLLSIVTVARTVHEMMFQMLNAQDPEDYTLVPMLASLPDVVEEANGQIGYAYKINDAARWPNGSPVTAADVVFSMKLVLNPLLASGAYRPYYEFVENVVTSPSDERRFKVITDGPYMLAKSVLGSLVIYPEYAYDSEKKLRKIRLQEMATDRGAEKLATDDDDLIAFAEKFNALAAGRTGDDLVGSGPYALTKWTPSEEIVLNKRDNYWADDASEEWLRAEPDQLVFKIIPDPSTMATALRDELVDVAVNLPIERFRELRKEPYLLDRYNFETVASFTYFGLLFNQQDPLFKDAATRRAVTKLVDVDQLIEQLYPGELATRIVGPVLPAKSYYNEDLKMIDYDPTAARADLEAAGWTDSNGNGIVDQMIDGELRELSFEFLIFPSSVSEAIATLVKEWARQGGVDVRPVTKDSRALFDELDKGNFKMAIVGQGFNADPDEFTQVWASSSVPPNGTNRGGFAVREADELIRELRVTIDQEERAPLYRRFQEIIYANQPMVFLFSPKDRVVVSRRFRYQIRSMTPNVGFNGLLREGWNE
ncbi:ABC transporter substrate-binding protein [Neolewinella antarctica]|uniref:Peptide/nickel transport system substrate-binding protein n=1 Tax=Neolewinella antarctica TaxID=442734 RepID=A0ABX0XB16_9BACT|nr:ABC transporter substrate-binding protein [Neolewinella antarctica]NJC26456.1 peptide/nickel transport system substrate-binding protein [Neolewinella antarctica]